MKRNGSTRLVAALVAGLFACASAGTALAGEGPDREYQPENSPNEYGERNRDRDCETVELFGVSVVDQDQAAPWAEFEHEGFNGAQNGNFPGGRTGN